MQVFQPFDEKRNHDHSFPAYRMRPISSLGTQPQFVQATLNSSGRASWSAASLDLIEVPVIVERPCALAVERQRHELLMGFVAQLAPYRVVGAGFAEANILPRVIYGQMFEGNVGHACFIAPSTSGFARHRRPGRPEASPR